MAGTWRLVRETTGKTVVAQLKIAAGFWSRLAGLQFRRPLPSDAGLLLVPCNSVHTCFVRFPVDVVFLDGNGSVLAVRRSLRPWRLAWGPREKPCCIGGRRRLGRRAARGKVATATCWPRRINAPQVRGISARIGECGRVRDRYNQQSPVAATPPPLLIATGRTANVNYFSEISEILARGCATFAFTVSGGTLDFSTPDATPSAGIVTVNSDGKVVLGALVGVSASSMAGSSAEDAWSGILSGNASGVQTTATTAAFWKKSSRPQSVIP